MKLSRSEQFAYDWQYRRLGDSFDGILAKLISKSDSGNRAKLRKAFPDEVDGITNFQAKEGWWDNVQKTIKEKQEKK